VTCRANRVVGYYSLAVGSVEPEDSPKRAFKGLARHPVPVMILARLAVGRSEQGTGIGKALLKDALLRTAQAADIAGIRALVVHAKNENARRWYERFDFEPSPTDPLHLFLLMKDLKNYSKGDDGTADFHDPTNLIAVPSRKSQFSCRSARLIG
jgi:hypothetical protein